MMSYTSYVKLFEIVQMLSQILIELAKRHGSWSKLWAAWYDGKKVQVGYFLLLMSCRIKELHWIRKNLQADSLRKNCLIDG